MASVITLWAEVAALLDSDRSLCGCYDQREVKVSQMNLWFEGYFNCVSWTHADKLMSVPGIIQSTQM